MSTKLTTSRNVFTLVELLVVIAIISILAGMLLPALEQARETAIGVSCMSNQKQVAYGIMQYADDSDGMMPLRGDRNLSYWSYPLCDYMELNRRDFITHGSAFFCPAATGYSESKWYRSYGINPNTINRKWASKLANVPKASQILMFGDKHVDNKDYIPVPLDAVHDYWGVYGWSSESHGTWKGGSNNLVLYWRHTGKVNFAFVDGHAESKHPEETIADRYNLKDTIWAWFDW